MSIDDLQARIAAVRLLHSPMHSPLGDVYCAHCTNQEMVEWPCLTVQALGAREDSEALRPAERTRADELRDWERCGKPHEHYPHEHVAIFNEGPTAPLHCDGKPKGSQ